MGLMVRVAAGAVLDRVVGDPPLPWPHPIVMIGRLIGWLESLLRRDHDTAGSQVFKGAVVVLVVVGSAVGVTLILLALGQRVYPGVGLAIEIWFISTTLALKGLIDAGGRVKDALMAGDLEAGREYVGQIVGRDTSSLTEEEVTRAALESLAENLSDGVIAPLFYLTLGGLPAAIGYKAVNTLDSMLGYRSARYEYFGKVSARIDDIANYIPARITGLLLATTAPLVGAALGRSFRSMRDFAGLHPSPNAGYPEAAAAGGLGVQLGGPTAYEGRIDHRPRLGWAVRSVEPRLLGQMISWNQAAAVLGLALFWAARWLVGMLV